MRRHPLFASKIYIGLVVCLSIFTDVFVYGVIVPVMPHALHERAGIPDEDLQTWNAALMACYAGAVLVGSVIFGLVGQQVKGIKLPFVLGQLFLVAALLMFAFTTSMPTLVVARCMQGCSTGVVFTSCYPLLYNAVGPARIGEAIGYTSMSLSIGYFLGPIVGGVIYDAAGFEWVFAPCVMLAGLEGLMRLLIVEPPRYNATAPDEFDSSTADQSRERDPLLAAPEDWHGRSIRHSPQTSRSMSYDQAPSRSNAAETSFSEASHHGKSTSSLRLLLHKPRFLTCMATLFALNNFCSALETVLPVLMYERFHFSSTKSALVLLTLIAATLFSPLTGRLADHFGAKVVMLSGVALWIPALFCMLLVDDPKLSTDAQLKALIISLAVFSIGYALAFPCTYSEVSATVEELQNERPETLDGHGAMILGFGLENAAFGLGAMIGPIYGAAVKERFGFGAMCAVFGVFSGILCVPVALFTGRRLFTKRNTSSVKPDAQSDCQ